MAIGTIEFVLQARALWHRFAAPVAASIRMSLASLENDFGKRFLHCQREFSGHSRLHWFARSGSIPRADRRSRHCIYRINDMLCFWRKDGVRPDWCHKKFHDILAHLLQALFAKRCGWILRSPWTLRAVVELDDSSLGPTFLAGKRRECNMFRVKGKNKMNRPARKLKGLGQPQYTQLKVWARRRTSSLRNLASR